VDPLPLLILGERYALTLMGVMIAVLAARLYRAGFPRSSAVLIGVGGVFAFLWKFVFLVFGEGTLTEGMSEVFEVSFAMFTSLGIVVYITSLYWEYSKTLEKSEERFRTLFESATDAIFILDQEGNFIDVNKTAYESLGYTKDEMLTMHISQLEPPGLGHKCAEGLDLLKKQGRAVFESAHQRKDGTIVPVEINSRMISFNGEEVFFSLVRDITQRKRAEEELKIYSKRLEEANRLKDLFTDILRHDLMNPLHVITMFHSQLKEEPGLPDEVKGYLGILEDSTDKAIRLVENAATYAKLESVDEVEFELLDLLTLLEHALKELEPLLGKEVSRVVLKGSGEYHIKANLIISEVFTNLITNAVKHSPAETRIELGITDEGDRYTVYVKDWGEGIPDQDKTVIFERFKRKASAGVKGTGLGLTISKRIVELHGGKIWVEDNPEGGSIFFVSLPKGS